MPHGPIVWLPGNKPYNQLPPDHIIRQLKDLITTVRSCDEIMIISLEISAGESFPTPGSCLIFSMIK